MYIGLTIGFPGQVSTQLNSALKMWKVKKYADSYGKSILMIKLVIKCLNESLEFIF